MWRWFRPDADLVEQVLVGGIVVDLVLFATSDMAKLNAHELAVVLPFSAVLAARPAESAEAPLAAFLEAHHLTYGIASYWEASIVTVEPTAGSACGRS